eukprot:Selendium_serpulae@DN5659_c0_g1_i1.p1
MTYPAHPSVGPALNRPPVCPPIPPPWSSSVAPHLSLAGEPVHEPRFPYGLCLVPNRELTARFRGFPPYFTFWEILQHVERGALMYDLVAIKEPVVLEDPGLLHEFSHKIGEVFLTEKFVNSTFGDQKLFVQHQPFEWDLDHRPDWNRYMNPYYLGRTGAPAAYSGLFKKPNPIDAPGQNFLDLMEGLYDVFTNYESFYRQIEILGITPSQLYNDLVRYTFAAYKEDPPDLAPPIRSPKVNPEYRQIRQQYKVEFLDNLQQILGDSISDVISKYRYGPADRYSPDFARKAAEAAPGVTAAEAFAADVQPLPSCAVDSAFVQTEVAAAMSHAAYAPLDNSARSRGREL